MWAAGIGLGQELYFHTGLSPAGSLQMKMLRLLKSPAPDRQIFSQRTSTDKVCLSKEDAAPLIALGPPCFMTASRQPWPPHGDTRNGCGLGAGSSPSHREESFILQWVFFSWSRLSPGDAACHLRREVEGILSAARWELRKTSPFPSCGLHQCWIHVRVPGRRSCPLLL